MADRYDLVIVGMGSGGMVAAELAAAAGLRVAVVERDRPGGDCLWTGCVPSKALLASARVAHTVRTADRWGVPAADPDVDTALVWKRLDAVRHEIAATDDDPERFVRMGVEVVPGEARLVAPRVVEVAGRRLRTRFVLLCTGSRPAVPPVDGLREAGFLTSESVFDLERAPESVAMIGGGPISVELAQAFARLGTGVTVLQRGPRLLPRDEPELVAALTGVLAAEGVDVRVGAEVGSVTVEGGTKVLRGTEAGRAASWSAAEVLVGAGREPNVEGLGLDELGVVVGKKGVEVDDRMRTNLPWLYAAGDVAGRWLFTHSAAHEAARAVRDMFFPGRGRVSDVVPWCTFTDPELAHVGLTAAEALERHGRSVDVHRRSLRRSDRARADGHTEGAVVLVTARGRLVGAHVLAPAAGEVIGELALAVRRRMRLTELAGLVHVYPTVSTTVAQLGAEAAYASARRFRWLARLGGARLPRPTRRLRDA